MHSPLDSIPHIYGRVHAPVHRRTCFQHICKRTHVPTPRRFLSKPSAAFYLLLLLLFCVFFCMYLVLFGLRGCLNFFGQRTCSMCSEGLVLNCCTCAVGGAHKDRVEWVRRQLDSPATFSLPDSVSKRAVVDKRSSLREDSVNRHVHDLSEEFAHPQINVLHLPQHFSQLEARNSDNDILNNKHERQKTAAIFRSLSHVHKIRTLYSNRRRKGQLSARPRGTIAVLDQTNAIFSLHNRPAGRCPYISHGRNLYTCLNRPEFVFIFMGGDE